MKTLNDLYRKPFAFLANRYEAYQDGRCIGSGDIFSSILSIPQGRNIGFDIQGDVPESMSNHFLLFADFADSDILVDRIQYGRLYNDLRNLDKRIPIVCNLFSNMNCIRFALPNPLRIVEFYGSYGEIQM